jgi:hypothetical protein
LVSVFAVKFDSTINLDWETVKQHRPFVCKQLCAKQQWEENMKSLTDILIGIGGVAALLIGFWQLMTFVGYRDPEGKPDMWLGVNHLYIASVCLIIAIACVVIYFVRHPRVEEEIHVTK